MKWHVVIEWKAGQPVQEQRLKSTGELKAFLERVMFCERHGCPLPLSVEINRVLVRPKVSGTSGT